MTWHHFVTTYFQWCLFPISLLGVHLQGKKRTVGWLMSLFTQLLWAIYAIALGQPGMLVGTSFYAAMYVKNWLKWRREDRQAQLKADGLLREEDDSE